MTPSIHHAAALAKNAARKLAALDSDTKNRALEQIATTLEQSALSILEANRRDLEDARSSSIPSAALSRMALTTEKIEQIALGVRTVAR